MSNLIEINNIVTKQVHVTVTFSQENLIHFNTMMESCEVKANLSDPVVKKSYDAFMQITKEFIALEQGLEEAYGKPDVK